MHVRECDELRRVLNTNLPHQSHKHTFTSYIKTVLVGLRDSGKTVMKGMELYRMKNEFKKEVEFRSP